MTSGARETVSEADLLRIFIHGTTVFELLRTALDLDLFEHLEATGGLDQRELAEALGIAERPARMILLSLASLRLVRRDSDRKYRNADIVRSRLLRGSPRFLGPLVDIQAEIINPGMADLTESVRRNTNAGLRTLPGPGTTIYERLTAHPHLQEVYYGNMGDASKKGSVPLLDTFDFSAMKHVVDLAGGNGVNAIELASRYPNLQITLYDQDTVVQRAAENAERAGVAGRVHAVARDIFAGDYTGPVDAFLALNTFGIWSIKRNTELFGKCHAALPEGGALLVYDFVSNDDRTGSLTAGLMSPYFLALSSEEGMVYAPGDMEEALRSAGFSQIERHTGMGFNHALVVGYK